MVIIQVKKRVKKKKKEKNDTGGLFFFTDKQCTLEFIDRALLSAFYNFAEPLLPKDIVEKFSSLKRISDLRFPSEWFPDARQMKR